MPTPDPSELQRYLNNLVRDNTIRRITVARKITELRKSHESHWAASHLSDTLAKKVSGKQIASEALVQKIIGRASAKVKKNGITEMAKQEIRLRLLEAEAQLLEMLLKDYSVLPLHEK